MHITRIDFPASNDFGLGAIRMERLGKVVVIAGKNGAGKSRLFHKLAAWLEAPVRPDSIPRRQFFNVAVELIAKAKDSHLSESSPEFHAIIENLFRAYQVDKETFQQVTFSELGVPKVINFVPKALELADPNQMTKANLSNAANNVSQVGVEYLANGTFAQIQELQNQHWEATHQYASFPIEKQQEIKERYQNLCSLIQVFLGCDLTRSPNSDAELFKRPLGQAQLSNGQKVLLQFCVAIHAQANKLNNLIILMDEPENHLHPAAVLDAIETIERHLTKGQLWVATHSLPLLANFDPSTIWWMDGGSVSYAGTTPGKVLEGLIGNEERIGKLGDFLDLPAVLASNRFAQQCLVAPEAQETGPEDAQTTQIRTLILNLKQTGQIRVLDYGAGRGRLASAIHENGGNNQELAKRIDYIGFDPDPKHKGVCEVAIQRLCGSSDMRYLNDIGGLFSSFGKGTSDVVVMCNVLHEIDPGKWLDLFKSEGAIAQFLREDGFLLVVEDTRLPIGEKAYQGGFLVLDTAHIKALFKIEEKEIGFIVADARQDGRLKAHLIPKCCLGRITAESRLEALKDVKQHARDKILEIRNKPPDYKSGRLHAFYVQQFANADIALSQY